MPKVLHRADSVFGSFDGAGLRGFAAGEVREVNDEAAAYLLKHHPEQFELVKAKTVRTKSAAVDAPPKTSAAKPPAKRKRKAPVKKADK